MIGARVLTAAPAAELRREFMRLCHDLAIAPLSPRVVVDEVVARVRNSGAYGIAMGASTTLLVNALEKVRAALLADPLDAGVLIERLNEVAALQNTWPSDISKQFDLAARRLMVCKEAEALFPPGTVLQPHEIAKAVHELRVAVEKYRGAK